MKYDWIEASRESPPEPPDGSLVEYAGELDEDPEAFEEKLEDGEYDVEHVMETIGEALTSEDPGAQRVGLEVFRDLVGIFPDVVDEDAGHLTDLLETQNVWVAKEAIALIDEMTSVNAPPFRRDVSTIAMFADPEIDRDVRVHALGAVASIVWANTFTFSYASDQVQAALDDPYPKVREQALRAVTAAIDGDKLDASDYVDRFLDALESGYAGERGAGAMGLAVVAPADREAVRPAVSDVVEMARSDDPAERDDAVHALYWLSTPFPDVVADGVDRLTRLAADPEVPEGVRGSAVGAVTNVTKPLGAVDGLPVDPLVEMIDERDDMASMAALVVGDATVAVGDATTDPDRFAPAFDPLLEWHEAADPDREEPIVNVYYALGGLAGEDPQAVRDVAERLVETARSADRTRARGAVRELASLAEGIPGTVASVLGVDEDAADPEDLLGDSPEAATCRALLAGEVPGYADPDVVDAMFDQEDPDMGRRYMRAFGLVRIARTDPRVVQGAIEDVAGELDAEEGGNIRALLVRALGHVGTERAREIVEAGSDAYDYSVRNAVSDALERIERSDGPGGPGGPEDGATDRASTAPGEATPGEADEPDEAADPGQVEEADDGPTAEAKERIRTVLEDHYGQLNESQIVAETGWASDRVADVLSAMDEAGAVDRVALGNDYIVSLPREGDGDADADADPGERPDAVDLAVVIGDADTARALGPVVQTADGSGRVRFEDVDDVDADQWGSLVEAGYLQEDGDGAVVSLPEGIDFEFPDR